MTDDRTFLGRPVPADDHRFAAGRTRAHPADVPLRVVVVGDSCSFTDETGPQPPGTAGLWPREVGELLEQRLGRPVAVDVLARPARTAAGALDLFHRDQHARHVVLPAASAVVAAWGSYDHAPVGVPPVLRAVLPHVHADGTRRALRRRLHALQPRLVRATRARVMRTPTARFERLHRDALHQLRSLAFGAAGVALGPTSHRSRYYGDRHPGFADRADLQQRLAVEDGWAVVEPWPLVLPHVEDLNPDGIHWPRVVHRDVAAAVAAALHEQLAGRAPRPPRPGLAGG